MSLLIIEGIINSRRTVAQRIALIAAATLLFHFTSNPSASAQTLSGNTKSATISATSKKYAGLQSCADSKTSVPKLN